MTRRSLRPLAAAALVAGLIAASALPAFAQYPPAEGGLQTTTSTITQGGSTTLTGGGFLAGSEIDLYIFSEPRFLGSTRANGNGQFTTDVKIPADLQNGSHRIEARGKDPDGKPRTLALEITVGPVAAAKPATGLGGGAIAGIVAGALAVLGLLIFAATRKKEEKETTGVAS